MKIPVVSIEKKNTIVFILSDLLSKAIPFLLIPIITRYLTPEEYGNVSIFLLSVQVLVIAFINGSNTYYRANFTKVNSKETLLNECFANLVISSVIIVTITIAVYFFLVFFLGANVDGKFIGGYGFLSILITAFFQSVVLLFIAYFQCEKNARFVGGVNLSLAAFNTIFCIILLKLGLKEEARYFSMAFVYAIVALILYLINFNGIVSSVRSSFNRGVFGFGLSIFPHAISWWLRKGAEKLVIGSMIGVGMVGKYSLFMQFISILVIVSTGINQAYTPKLMELLSVKNKGSAIRLMRLMLSIMVVFSFVFGLLLFISFDVIVPEDYTGLKPYIPLSIIAVVFQAYTTITSNVFYFYGESTLLSKITVLFSLLNVIMNVALIKVGFGIETIFISSVVTYLLMSFVIKSKCKKILRAEY